MDNDAHMWDVATGRLVFTLSGHTKDVTRVTYSPDGRYVVTGSNDSTALLWDIGTGKQVQIFPGHDQGVSVLSFLPNIKYLATGDIHTARIWDIATAQVVS